jgi:hydrogenase maturation protein HypF
MDPSASHEQLLRRRVRVEGIVQGVGFRPFVYRLATDLGLAGFVLNDADGVLVEVEGTPTGIDSFVRRLEREAPPLSKITRVDSAVIQYLNESAFMIRPSRSDEEPLTLIPPDVAVCDDCLRELFDPRDRRYRYPFINCTNCGPRFTIVEGIPYDRPNTSMKRFTLCPECSREYHDPADRRFHAQPNACPVCGPRLTLKSGAETIPSDDPIADCVELLRSGRIVAIRGVGGFHLAVDADNEGAVAELRRRKGRAEKPLALMTADVDTVRRRCILSEYEESLLRHYRRPIVLLKRKPDNDIAEAVAPGNKYLGFMLAYSPLHHLLLRDNFDALVMTSANYSEEPIAIVNDEALQRLRELADYFLLHDREILQRCDDSIMRYVSGAVRPIRRARGYVPEPVFISEPVKRPILACGGELKNTVALARGKTVFLSQHIGDLDNPSALEFFEHCIALHKSILGIEPDLIACDMHPEYLSAKWAKRQNLPVVEVQHHHAHLVSVMAENGVQEKTIGVILDGTGYGIDGTIWGGELLIGDAGDFSRYAWLDPVPMPGGASAISEPWRMGISYLRHTFGREFKLLDLPLIREMEPPKLDIIARMMEREINSPLTSSCGRLFDGVAAILGMRSKVSYEAQAAIELEMLATDAALSAISIGAPSGAGPLDIRPIIRHIADGVLTGRAKSELAAEFHVMLAELFVDAAVSARKETGVKIVGLSGGVYQNELFFARMLKRLESEGFRVLTHTQVPANDGGIALGQAVIADAKFRSAKM